MAKPVLTRYLYIYDEVLLSLQQSILTKSSFDEAVFWTCELFYSGYESKLWEFIYKLYYNFYAIIYPKYERKLTKLSENSNLEHILNAICILYHSKINIDVFKLYQVRPKTPTKHYKKHPLWLSEMGIDDKYSNFLIALDKEHYLNMMYYLNKFDDFIKVYEIVKRYFREIHGMKLNDKPVNSVKYNDLRHIITALILYLRKDISTINKKSIFKKYTHSDFLDQIKSDNKPVERKYKTLPHRLRYTISDKIGCFKLSRSELNCSVSEMLWYHWEYFAYETPLWKKRFDKYKIKINHEKQKIEFLDVDEEEEFYDQWYYEPDEQTKEVQNRITIDIPKICILDWFKLVKN